MPNTVDSLKTQLLRLARKQAESQISRFRKTAAESRREVTELRRLLRQRERELAYLRKQQQTPAEENPLAGVRFSARSVRAQRLRLGLSAKDYGRLVGVSALTIHSWEQCKSRPRKSQFVRLVAVRGISKKAALAKLAESEAVAKKRR